MADTIRLVAMILVVLIALAAVAAIVFVTRAGLAIHRPVIDLLHLIGATDAYVARQFERSEEHTSELQSLMRISYAVFCLKKKTDSTKSTHANTLLHIPQYEQQP